MSGSAIELRTTHIRMFDARLVYVPNGQVLSSHVTNRFGAGRLHRARLKARLALVKALTAAGIEPSIPPATVDAPPTGSLRA